ncbi:3032_t:CDS:2 [Cetraspora pellucida]|uniref:3032_t:CDS:1 n=1 Tax=Cetraspora pellucida TaxID=1433469 RepID=A0A9N8VJC9_9GLOM|nr:3032_t:CDS:2 [Cetraspora pellucida]
MDTIVISYSKKYAKHSSKFLKACHNEVIASSPLLNDWIDIDNAWVKQRNSSRSNERVQRISIDRGLPSYLEDSERNENMKLSDLEEIDTMWEPQKHKDLQSDVKASLNIAYVSENFCSPVIKNVIGIGSSDESGITLPGL